MATTKKKTTKKKVAKKKVSARKATPTKQKEDEGAGPARSRVDLFAGLLQEIEAKQEEEDVRDEMVAVLERATEFLANSEKTYTLDQLNRLEKGILDALTKKAVVSGLTAKKKKTNTPSPTAIKDYFTNEQVPLVVEKLEELGVSPEELNEEQAKDVMEHARGARPRRFNLETAIQRIQDAVERA